MIGIEIDEIICNHISHIFKNEINSKQLELIKGDVEIRMASDFTDIVANIPYQISFSFRKNY